MRSLICLLLLSQAAWSDPVRIGSKYFAEGQLLGEMAAQRLEEGGYQVERHLAMGATGILFAAVKSGGIDVYPEYSGTISEAILKRPELRKLREIREALAPLGLTVSESLGFSDSYALAIKKTSAEKLHIRSISDLRNLQLRAGFSNEFMSRKDGLSSLQKHYAIRWQSVKSLEHSLAYEALENRSIDITDVYTTDPQIEKMGLLVLDDDHRAFPDYDAVWLARTEFVVHHPNAWKLLRGFEGRLRARAIRGLNYKVALAHEPVSEVVRAFLHASDPKSGASSVLWREIGLRTRQHLFLVGVSILFAGLIGIPLGVLAAYSEIIGHVVLTVGSIVQTIPSLALLCFLIPLFGIGTKAALVALFLYSLLPVIVDTFTGIRGINVHLVEAARALGLTFFQRLRLIEFPLALPNILAGVRTSAIIGIGTATLAALIGAGGYGVPIVTGLAINDIPTILTGAIPAAIMSLLTNYLFVWLEKLLLPRGLRR